MNGLRRTTLLLSVLASAAFWLLVDSPSRLMTARDRLDGYDTSWPSDLAVIPFWKLLLLLGVTTLVVYTTSRAIQSLGRTPRQRLLLWPLALAALWGGWHAGSIALWERVDLFATEAYQPLRFERSQLSGSAWIDVAHRACGYFTKDVVVFESETRAVRHSYGSFVSERLLTVYFLLDVWPYGERTSTGEVRDGIVTWHGESAPWSRQRLHLADGELTLTYIQ